MTTVKDSDEPFCEFCGKTLDRKGKDGKYGKLQWLLGDFSGNRPRKGQFESHSLHEGCWKDFARPVLTVKVFKFTEPIREKKDEPNKEEPKPVPRAFIPISEIDMCPVCGEKLVRKEGCMICPTGDWSACK